MRTAVAAFATVTLVACLAACGGSSSSSSSSSGETGTTTGPTSASLVAKVSHAEASFQGSQIVASTEVEEGGHPGEKLTLRYGLVDAVSGSRASEEEQVAARYVTTSQVKKVTETVKIPKPTPTDYLVHFVLYGTDGSYLASSDSDVFTVGS
jgi:hypothetical protein